MTQENSALVPTNYNKRPREAKKTKDSTFDRIWKYYHNSKTRIELEDWEHEIRERWEAAWFLLCKARNQKAVADEIETIFSVSKSVAYDDVRHAMNLFSDPRQNVKEAKRAIAETMALRGMEKSELASDWEMRERYLQKYIDLNGLKDTGGDNRIEDLIKKFQPHTIIIGTSAPDLEAMVDALQDELSKTPEYSEAKIVE
jgi:hypothetical protein